MRGNAARSEFVDADEAFRRASGRAFPVCSARRCWNKSSDAENLFPQYVESGPTQLQLWNRNT